MGGALTRRENQFDNQTLSANTWESRIIGTYKNIAESNIDFNVWYKYSGKQPGFVKNENGSVTPTFCF